MEHFIDLLKKRRTVEAERSRKLEELLLFRNPTISEALVGAQQYLTR